MGELLIVSEAVLRIRIIYVYKKCSSSSYDEIKCESLSLSTSLLFPHSKLS